MKKLSARKSFSTQSAKLFTQARAGLDHGLSRESVS